MDIEDIFGTLVVIGLLAFLAFLIYPTAYSSLNTETKTLVGTPQVQVLTNNNGNIEYLLVTMDNNTYKIRTSVTDPIDFTVHSRIVLEIHKGNYPYNPLPFLPGPDDNGNWVINKMYKIPD